MNQDFWLGAEVREFDACGSGLQEASNVVEVVRLTEWPEEACSNFITNRDNI